MTAASQNFQAIAASTRTKVGRATPVAFGHRKTGLIRLSHLQKIEFGVMKFICLFEDFL